MRKIICIFCLFALLFPMKVLSQQPYAVLSSNNTVLTFYYDNQKVARGGMSVGPFPWYDGGGYDGNEMIINSGWDEEREIIRKVVFDASFAACTSLTNTDCWFYGCYNLTSIENIEYLHTDKVTSMAWMFYNCRSLTTLDLSGFNTQNVGDMTYMFSGCSNLQTIYVGNNWSTEICDVDWLFPMFDGCTKLVGGRGTTYSAYFDNTYAHIDGGAANPGYFTGKSSTTVSEPYAVLSNNNTVLAFYYDNLKAASGGMDVTFTGWSRGWHGTSETITSVVFDASFANCTTLTSTAYWFYDCRNLTSITGINYLNTSNVTDMSCMFAYCCGLTSLDVSGFKTGNVTDMTSMFFGCSSLTSLDVSNFNTSNVTSMYGLFSGCSGLTCLDVSGFNTQNVYNLGYLFSGCSGLTSLDLSVFKTQKVSCMDGMFLLCSGLTSLDLSSFKMDNVSEMREMFAGCSSLTTIEVRYSWDKTRPISDNMFIDCTKLVGGMGTTYNADYVDAAYAHIDGGPTYPGYFTGKNAPVDTPTISRSGTTNSIIMTCSTSGATIYYTTDGTTPTKNSTQYTGTVTISGNCTIKAIAIKDGYESSNVATYNVNWFKVATPTFSYSNLKLTISTTTEGATIYYTTNGSTPTTSSTKYTGAITLSQDCTIKAIAVKDNYTNSDVATYNFVLNDVTCQTPTISRSGSTNSIVMTCATSEATIYYTTDGTTPTKNSTQYTGAVTVSGNCTLKAIAMKDGYVSSSVATYNVNWFKVATPTFSYSNLKLSISTTTSGATIYYTTDGSTPTTSSTKYSGAISLSKDCTVKAIAVKTNYTNSDVAIYNFVLNDVICQTPTISRDGTSNRIVMNCTTTGASIYYTTDGTTPTSNSTRYTASITVSGNCTIKAIAMKDGYVSSSVATYNVSWFKVATPTFSYSNLKLSISTTTEGATIYYTTDGSTPTTSSTKYSGTISLSKDCTVKAIAVKDNYTNSDVASYDFVMSNYTCLAPQISRSGTTNSIVMTCGTSGASIYYTTDGTTPTQASTCYSGSITVDHNQTIRAVAMKDGMFNSTQSQFTVDWFKVATPTFSYSNLQLSISTTTSGATIYYTTDGSIPTTSSTKYSGSISLSQDCTVKAIAVKGNYTNSDVAIYDFVLNDVTCQTPTISRDETSNRIVMNCTTTGASIYYTTNGTTPTANSTRYTASITISGNCTIQAIAMKDGCENSSVAIYTVDWFTVATPIFSFDNMQLTISTTTSGATIYYTTDGSTPTTSSTKYSGAISLSKDCTVKAIAVKDNYNDSEVATFIFKKDDVTCQAPQIQRDETSNDVIMTCATAGATIYYTTNGTTPTENNTRYAGPITVTKNCTIKAIAVKDGYESSGVATYNVDWFKVATPTFSYSNQKLSISTTTEGATIYYTTDGSTPSTTNTKAQVYSSPISLTGSTTVKAIAVKADYTNSDVATYNFVIDSYTCQAPQISRSGTTNSIIMTCGTSGASIYYTTDGTTPTNGSARFSGPITVDHNQTIRAIAMKDGMFNSAQSQFTVDWFKVATPTFSYSNLQLTISTATSGAIVYYTTDGSNPLTELSKAIRYTNPIQLEANATIKAAAVKTDFSNSDVATYSFVKADYVCKQPQITRDGTSDRLTMSSATENAIIYYTIDGSTPTTSSTQYTGPVTMPYNCVVRAIATRSDMFTSDVNEFTVDWLTISGVTVAYNNGVLTLTCATQGAEIHYEIGGKDATKSSPLYTGPITLTDNREVRYVVYASGMEPVSGSYTPTDFACAPVTLTYDGLNIELSTTEEGATIYYTLDGSTPTISSAVYRGKTPLTDLCTVKAIAVKTYKNDSEVTQTITYFFDGTTLSMSETGHVKDAMKWSGTDNIPELTIKCQGSGSISADDMSFLRTINGLKHLNLKDALFVNNTVPTGAFSGMNIVSVEFPSTNITTLGNVFSGCKHLAAIIWNAHVLMASTTQVAGISNPNLLLYVDNESYAPKQGIRNVIVNGRAKNIVLTDEDGGSYYCPQAFQAQIISYTHTYSQTTGINKECRGWETIALPFDVQTVAHERNGRIAPFAAKDVEARPFWLGELSSNGFTPATEIRANTPYIISMPNNDVYGSSYILAGKVTFEAVNTTVPVTEIKTASKGTHVFTPCFDAVEASSTIFVLNKDDNTEFTEGSVFLPSYRDVKPFEACIAVPEVSVAPRYIPIRDDSDTGIEQTPTLPEREDIVYNLQGQRISVSPDSSVLPKGVYIMNGRKVLVK